MYDWVGQAKLWECGGFCGCKLTSVMTMGRPSHGCGGFFFFHFVTILRHHCCLQSLAVPAVSCTLTLKSRLTNIHRSISPQSVIGMWSVNLCLISSLDI